MLPGCCQNATVIETLAVPLTVEDSVRRYYDHFAHRYQPDLAGRDEARRFAAEHCQATRSAAPGSNVRRLRDGLNHVPTLAIASQRIVLWVSPPEHEPKQLRVRLN